MSNRNPGFHAFTIKHNGIAHRIITDVKVSQTFDPSNLPDPINHVDAKALWDTGASRSCLSPSVASALGLVPAGTALMRHARGEEQCNTYLVNFYLPNLVAFAGVLVNEFAETDFGVIIGMDIIGAGDFALTNVNGETWLSFRVPSKKAIDYVVEHDKIMFGGVRPSDLCPCGRTENNRRLKYRECHGRRQP